MSILNIILFQVHAVQIFSSVLWVAFYTLLIMSSDTQKLSIFMRSNLFVFFFRLLPVFLSLHPRDYCQILGWPESSFGFSVIQAPRGWVDGRWRAGPHAWGAAWYSQLGTADS